jgi:hypothetical protein
MLKSILSFQYAGNDEMLSQNLDTAKYVAQSKCLKLSTSTIDAICSYSEADVSRVRGVTWYGMYFLVQAILIMDLAWLQGARLIDQHEFETIRRRGEQTLVVFAETNASANRFVRFLKRIQTHHAAMNLSHVASDPQYNGEQTSLISPSAAALTPSYGTESVMFDQNMWFDPSFNMLLDDPFVASVFDDVSFYPT